MTLVMQDSITPANLTGGADAYLGYVDGRWVTFPLLQRQFPHAHLLSMSVFASDNADGCDREPGDLGAGQVAGWVQRQLARGVWRPVVYASASNMGACVASLSQAGVARADVRLLSAHYGAGKHICGPSTCNLCPAVDGTQWTDAAPGAGGSLIDESVLLDDFFGDTTVALTPADIAAVAKATAQLVWTVDGIVPAPGSPPANPYWAPGRMLADIGMQARAIEALVAKSGTDPAAVAADVLKGLDPATIAATIATSLGPDVGQLVLAALAARLSTPA
jgi:hypothetical protein